MARALVLGDSHVYWLERFANDQNLPGTTMRISEIRLEGIRGGGIESVKQVRITNLIRAFAPDIVVLHVGGNDIDGHKAPQLIGMRLYELAKSLIARGVRHVIICQIVRRQKWRHFSPEQGAMAAVAANEFLAAVCDGCADISFWKHKGLWSSVRPVFRLDGVHYNELGNYKLFRSVRGAILYASSAVLSAMS